MKRCDVVAARDLAAAFVKVSDQMLASEGRHWDGNAWVVEDWTETAWIAGKLTGSHRRLSLDLTRALAHMRRRR